MSPWRPGGYGSFGRDGGTGSCRRISSPIRGPGTPVRSGAIGTRGMWKATLGAGVLATGVMAPTVLSGNVNSRGGARPGDIGHSSRRVTDLLLALNIGVAATNWAIGGDVLLAAGAKVNSAILAGQWWRLFTASALHAGPIHLLVNCFSLHNLGPSLEIISGKERFLTVYIAAAFTGGLASFCFSSRPSVGASGAVFGLGGALAVFFYRHRDMLGRQSDRTLAQLRNAFIINMIFGLLSRNIDNWGHIGGLLGGAAVSWLLGPRLIKERPLGSKRARIVDKPPLPIFTAKLQ